MKENQGFEPGEMDLPEGWTPEKDTDPGWQNVVRFMREAGQPPAVPADRFAAMKRELRNQLSDEGLIGVGLRDVEMPADWAPDNEQGVRWKGIVALMKVANQPPDVPPARFAAMKMELDRQLRAEGLIRESAATGGFGEWLHSLLLGGGIGGQLVRFGAVGAVVFFAAQGGHQTTESGLITSTETASTVVASAATPATPARTSSAPSSIQGFAIERGVNATSPASVPQEITWISTMPTDRAVVTVPGSAAMVPVAAAPRTERNRNLAIEAFDQLQTLKFISMTQQDDRQLAEIRRVEHILSQMLEETGERTASAELRSHELYRMGEQLFAAGRYGEAVEVFDKAVDANPGSQIAFVSLFQIGRIAFDYLQDFELAREAFESCLNEYTAHVSSNRHKAYLEEHLAVLRQTSADNWRTLRTWQAAKTSSSPSEALRLLMDVIGSSPSKVIAVDASDRIREILLSDSVFAEETIADVLEAMEARVATEQAAPTTARIQFNRAEIISRRRPGDLSAVAAEYARVLQLSPDDNVSRAARIRLNLIQSQLSPQRIP